MSIISKIKAAWAFAADRLRMADFGIIALLLFAVIAMVAPQQLAVVIYKIALVMLFAHLGYWVHRRVFRKLGREDDAYEPGEIWLVVMSRSIIVAAVIVAGALAL
jgi:positive regulator of sigma E activity